MVFAYKIYDQKYFRLKMNCPAANNGVSIRIFIIFPRGAGLDLRVNKMRKETRESNKEITIIGIVREIDDNWKSYRVGIATENRSYVVGMNAEGNNLRYEVGNKVEATGIITRTKEGIHRIEVTGYEVFEMDEDDLDEFGRDSEYYFRGRSN